MHDTTTKNQFIELRAQGLSLRKIAGQIPVSKSTLDRWDDECLPQIQRLRALEWEAIEEDLGRRLEDDLKSLSARIRKWEAELDALDPGYETVPVMLRVIRECRREYMHVVPSSWPLWKARPALPSAPLSPALPTAQARNPSESRLQTVTSHPRKNGTKPKQYDHCALDYQRLTTVARPAVPFCNRGSTAAAYNPR